MTNAADRKAEHSTAGILANGGIASTAYPTAVAMPDRWIKWRMYFLLAVSTMYLIRLIFFRDVALADFDIDSGHAPALSAYMNWRIASSMSVIALYLFSYLRRWHFAVISWIIAGIAVVALVSDYFTVYMLTISQPPQWMTGVLALRLVVIGCLLLNALNARRLPPRRIV